MGRRFFILVVGALVWAGAVRGVRAVDSTWISTAGSVWSDAARWNNGVPGPTTNAFLTNKVSTSYTATNDLLNNTIGNLTIYNLGTGTNTLWNGANGFNPTGTVIVGRNGALDVGGFTATVGSSLIVSNLGRLIVTNGSFLQVGTSADGVVTNGGTLFIGTGGTLAAGVVSNSGFIISYGGGLVTGSVANLRTSGTSFGTHGINVSGAQGDGSLSLVGPMPFLNQVNLGTIFLMTNATLNIGGTNAATATGSFTNRGTIASPTTSGSTRGITINAGTIVNDPGAFLNIINRDTATITNRINADVINHGTLSLNDTGCDWRFIRSLSNTGTFNLGDNAASQTFIEQGNLYNHGRVDAYGNSDETITVSQGHYINAAGATSLFTRTSINALGFVQDGTLIVNHSGVTANFRSTNGVTFLSVTNNGMLRWDPVSISGNVPVMTLDTLYNAATFQILGRTNLLPGSAGISTAQSAYLGGKFVNQAGGVLHVQTNALAAFDSVFDNLGTINVQSNSVLSAGRSASPGLGGTAWFIGGQNNWTNNGTVNLEAGAILAVRFLTNGPAGIIAGAGHIGPMVQTNLLIGTTSNYVRNLTVANLMNAGTIAPDGILNVGAITNLSGGTIIGRGVIQSLNITNFIEGASVVTSNINTGARILNSAGATLLASGGTLILSNGLLHNSNFGTLGATNGLLQLGNGTLPLTNNAGATLYVYNGGLNLGALRNEGTVQIVDSIVTFTNPVVNAGLYLSDPSTNIFLANVTIEPAGTLEGGPHDLFDFRANLFLHSTNSSLFDLASSTVAFSGGGSHTNAIVGFDLGPNYAGLTAANFAYGALDLSSLDNLVLTDGDGIGSNTNALYVGGLDLGGSTNNVSLLQSPFNIYYDPGHAWNAYLGAQTYPLSGGGFLIPLIPEPHTGMLLGAAALLLRVRRRHPCQVRQGAGGRA